MGITFTMADKNISRNEGISEMGTSIAISQETKVVYLAWEDSPEQYPRNSSVTRSLDADQ